MRKQLLLTFDYELFLGSQSGSIQDCLLDPTARIVTLLDRFRIKGVFFVDTTYLLRLRHNARTVAASRSDLELVSRQLGQLVADGHYVYPHIHPHWLDAVYDAASNEWRLNDITRYRFHHCSIADRGALFDGSIGVLKEILAGAGPNYRIDCYRAGGWCLQPFSDFREYFIQHGIKYDMTVLSGMYSFTNAQQFDFTGAPNKPIYRFHTDECTEDMNGRFFEFTISSLNPGRFLRLIDKAWNKIAALRHERANVSGRGILSKRLEKAPPTAAAGYDLLDNKVERIAVELLSPFKLNAYKKFLRKNDYMHFISHPKMITRTNLVQFQKFLDFATASFSLETDFKRMISAMDDGGQP